MAAGPTIRSLFLMILVSSLALPPPPPLPTSPRAPLSSSPPAPSPRALAGAAAKGRAALPVHPAVVRGTRRSALSLSRRQKKGYRRDLSAPPPSAPFWGGEQGGKKKDAPALGALSARARDKNTHRKVPSPKLGKRRNKKRALSAKAPFECEARKRREKKRKKEAKEKKGREGGLKKERERRGKASNAGLQPRSELGL